MERAMYRNQYVTPREFENQAGQGWRELGLHASCKICGSKATTRAVRSIRQDVHFRHENGVTDCPYSTNADVRFKQLIPNAYDPESAHRVRDAFLDEAAPRAHRFFQTMIGDSYSAHRYRAMLSVADRLRVWEYRDIKLWAIPFIMLTLIDFDVPVTDSNRPCAFQFRLLKPRKPKIDILWESERALLIEKVFIPGGIKMYRPEGNPWRVSEETFLAFSR
jgi:hypothetical protein